MIPGQKDTPFEHLPVGESAEWYMANMPSFNKQGGDSNADGPSSEESKGSGSPSPGGEESDKEQQTSAEGQEPSNSGDGNIPESLDDHSGWQECSQEVKEMARERLKETVRKAAEEASASNRWGSVSQSTRKKVMKMLETKIDWKKVLRYFVKSSQRANRSSSIKRINRRYAYIHPGRKTSRVAKVAISVDQSGSVDDKMLSMFFTELNKLAQIAEFVVIPFDTRVDESKIFTWKKGQTKLPERVLQGGTDFDAPTEYVNGKDFDGHIILTDMEAPKPKSSKCQRMWMTTRLCADRAFGTKERVIAVD